MFIIDVLRHGGGAHFDGLLLRLNNEGSIGWRFAWGREFESDEVRAEVRRMIVNGDLIADSMWDDRGVLSLQDALNSEWNDEILFSNAESASSDWSRWDPPRED